MDKYLLFQEQGTANAVGETVHDLACYPLSRFKGFTNTGTTNTELQMIFEGLEEGVADGDASSVDTVTLTITANKHVEATKDIANAIASNISGIIVISDNLTDEYVSSYVTASAINVVAVD